MSQTSEPDDATPGWDAITHAIETLYPGQEPAHFGPILSARLGGTDPLDGISAYRASHPRPHWHLVSYGMSELYAKESENAEWSGWGFEFTFRLARQAEERPDAQPPAWALHFLQNLARYVYQSGNLLEPGHHMDLNGPIALESATSITAALFAEDPQLPQITTPFGQLRFLQIVGITADELSAAEGWDVRKFLGVLSGIDPMLITDLDRASYLSRSTIAAEVERGTRADGSSTAVLYASAIEWKELDDGERLELTLGAKPIAGFKRMLSGRIPFGRGFLLQGSKVLVELQVADAVGWEIKEDRLIVKISAPDAVRLAEALRAKQGEYALDARLTVRVVPSRITNQKGEVIEVIGE